MRRIASCLLGLYLALIAALAVAQVDQIETGFGQVTADEEQKLRAVLAEPVPQGVLFETLRRHFDAKDIAAVRLGDNAAREVNLREQIRLKAANDRARVNFGVTLLRRGEIEEGNAAMRDAIRQAGSLDQKAFVTAIFARAMYAQFRDAEARALIVSAKGLVGGSNGSQSDWQRMVTPRTLSLIARAESLLEQRAGRYEKALAAALRGEEQARQATKFAWVESRGTTQEASIFAELAEALVQKIDAQTAAGRSTAAEKTIAEYLSLSNEVKLHWGYRAMINGAASGLRFSQREFAQAEALQRKSLETIRTVIKDEFYPSLTGGAAQLAMTLWAQKRWREALAEFERLDSLAGVDERSRDRVRFPFERGLVYLSNQMNSEAAALFRGEVFRNVDAYGPNHFNTAQATGLLGAALWRSGTSEQRALAVPMLKQAAASYMAPANADDLENTGVRKEVRELIFAAYLEAMALTPGEDPALALGAADWARGSTVQEALADAAVRSATTTPDLANLVRLDQDARNEIVGLRRYLAGELGASAAALPVVAPKMRARIAELETVREGLRSQLQQGFPDYDRLVRPAPISAAELARHLGPQEAFLLLAPSEDAVYAWAVTADRPAGFARINVAASEVGALVRRVRSSLELTQGRLPEFDSKAAHDLYRLLFAPLAPALSGKSHWVVAAGGALSQLPMGLLLTEPHAGIGTQAPWLIKQVSLTHVPSTSGWLAARRFSSSPRAPEALMGWADPTFGREPDRTLVAEPARQRRLLTTRNVTAGNSGQDSARSALRYADIPALPETRDELLAVAAVLKANVATDLRLGTLATRQSVLDASQSGALGRRRVVFFATHGIMAGDLPDLNQPALALAMTSQGLRDPLAPLLKLDDILSLNLNADWVVLSACNTAAADGRAEEALSGLARGFFYAGSRSLLVTHWSVESESAKRLTTSTFAYHAANPNASKAESLRQAMLEVMAQPQFAHPAFWAPYALVGDGAR